jgi:hypothetical protein
MIEVSLMRIRAITVPLVVAAIGAAGCGSSSSSSSTASSTPATTASGPPAPTRVYTAKLKGANEVPKASAAGLGTAKITVNGAKQQICWQFHLIGIAKPSVSHIHAAAAGVSGPVIVPLGGAYTASGCTSNVPAPEIKLIEASPAKYYVNVHNMKYPNGAARGQL